MIAALLEMLASGPARGAVRRRTLVGHAAELLRENRWAEQELLARAARMGLRHSTAAVFACLERHRLAEIALADAVACEVESPLFAGRLQVLRELLDTLFGDEDARVFPTIRSALTPEECASFLKDIDRHFAESRRGESREEDN